MKSTKVYALGLGALVLGLTSCGGTAATSSATSAEESATPSSSAASSSSSLSGNVHTAKVLYPDGSAVKAGEATVQWCDDKNCYQPVKVDADGVASIDSLKEGGTYYVHLSSLPEGYVYNPNIYVSDDNNKDLTIQLVENAGTINSYATAEAADAPDGSGAGKYGQRYMVGEGAYTVTLNHASDIVYLGFDPKTPGTYSLESWAVEKVPANAIDPYAALIGTGVAYQFDPENAIENYDNQGDSPNFRATLDVSEDDFVHLDEADEKGNPKLATDEDGNLIPGSSFTYALTTVSATEYPATFTIKLTREGDYIPPAKPEKEVVSCTATEKAAEPVEDTEFKFCAYDGTQIGVLGDDGYYHLNSKDGPLMYAALTKQLDIMDCSLQMAAAQQGTSYFITDQGTKTYEECFAAYVKLCNSDGVTYVTEQVKEMLDAIQKAQVYFTQSESLQGYFGTAAKGCEWMFACGYYTEKAGLKASNPIFLATEDATLVETLPAGRTLYYAASSKVACTWTITCNNENLEFAYDGKTQLGSEGDVVISCDGSERNLETFTITNKSESSLMMVAQVKYEIANANKDADNLVLGTNAITFSGGECYATFTAPQDGEYYLTSSDKNAYIAWEDGNVTTSFIPASESESEHKKLAKDDTWTLILAFDDFSDSGTVTFDIVKVGGATPSEGDGTTLHLGTNTCVVTEDMYNEEMCGATFTFTAPEKGTYVFSTTDSNCSSGVEHNNELDSVFFGCDATLALEKDETVNVYVGFDDWSHSGTTSITITKK